MNPQIEESLEILQTLANKVSSIIIACFHLHEEYSYDNDHIRVVVITCLGQVLVDALSFQDEIAKLASCGQNETEKQQLKEIISASTKELKILSNYELSKARNWMLVHNLRSDKKESVLINNEFENIKIPKSLSEYGFIKDALVFSVAKIKAELDKLKT